jgi:hypothetical protein
LVTLTATVPGAATYGAAHVLDVSVVGIDAGPAAIAATADDAVHLAAYIGDATGNRAYSGLDAQRVARIGVGLDSGLEAYPQIDPVIVADVTRNGALSGLDAQRIALEAAGLDTDAIPPIPPPLRLADVGRRSHRTVDAAAAVLSSPNSDEFGSAKPAATAVAAVSGTTSIVPFRTVPVLRGGAFEIADLPGNLLGLANGPSTKPDRDLLFVMLYEQGHVHDDRGLLDDTLPVGTRRLSDGAIFGLDQDVFGELDDLSKAIEQSERDRDALDKVFASLE